MVLGVVLWSARGRPASEAAALPQAKAPSALDEPHLDSPAPARDAVLQPKGPPAYPIELFDEKRYEGVGRLEVHVTTSNGSALPQRWTLSLEPAPTLIGGHRAVARKVEIEDGRATVVVEDVQLGGYAVRALVKDMDCQPEFVTLAKPVELDQIVAVRAFPMGVLSGRVVDVEGRPVEGIEVVLLSAGGALTRNAVTDVRGEYVFELVPDGDYSLSVGRRDGPLGSIADLSFAAPSLHAPDVAVPKLGELCVRVVDAQGSPVNRALVEGSGLSSGAIRLTTGSDGRACAPLCARGRILLYASEERTGAGNVVGSYDPEAPAEIEIRIAP